MFRDYDGKRAGLTMRSGRGERLSDEEPPHESSRLLDTPKTRALSVCSSARSFIRDTAANERTLDWLSVAFIAYFNVCGGPWGSETVVSSAGPLFGLAGITLGMLLSAVPMVLVTAELSSMFPDDGGYSIWVAEAFGEFWGFQESYWSWFSGLLDNTLYPVITFRLIEALCFPNGFEFWTAWLCKALLCIAFSFPNLVFLNAVGWGLAFAFLVVIFPFVVLCANAVFLHPGDPRTLLETSYAGGGEGDEPAGPDWVKFVNIVYWNVSGFDCISTCAGEVKNPGSSLLKGLMVSVVLVYLTYILPLSACASVNKPPWYTWRDGDFAVIAAQQVGNWLGGTVIFAGAIGNMGMHVAELFEDSWQLHGMAKCGLAPSLFAYKHPRLRTPITAVLFSVFLMVVLVAFPFERLMMVDNFFSVASGLLEFCAFLRLRHSRSRAIRPFRVPLDFCGAVFMIVVAGSISMIVLGSSLLEKDGRIGVHALVNSAAVIVGFLLYGVVKMGAAGYNRDASAAAAAAGGVLSASKFTSSYTTFGMSLFPPRRRSSATRGQAPSHGHTHPHAVAAAAAAGYPSSIFVTPAESNAKGRPPRPAATRHAHVQNLAVPYPSSTEATPGTPGYINSAGLSTSPLMLPVSGHSPAVGDDRALSDIMEVVNPRARARADEKKNAASEADETEADGPSEQQQQRQQQRSRQAYRAVPLLQQLRQEASLGDSDRKSRGAPSS